MKILLKDMLSTIKSAKKLELDAQQFNGFGFMHRIYGIEEIPDLNALNRELSPLSPDDLIERGLN